jgi:L-threonylcarbamoyladenylate synthase
VTAAVVSDDDAGRSAAIRILRAGGIVALPTDTVYGIAVDLAVDGGIERLFEAKRRPADRAIMLLLADAAQAAELAEWPPAAAVLAEAFWPGGLTLVLPQRLGITLPAVLTGGRRTIGLRVPDHPSPRALAAGVGPLPVTSANVSGLPSAGTAAEILAQLGDAIDLILDGGPSHGGPASTVVDCTGSQPRILRSGAIDPDAVAACLRSASLPEPAPWEDNRGSGGRE